MTAEILLQGALKQSDNPQANSRKKSLDFTQHLIRLFLYGRVVNKICGCISVFSQTVSWHKGEGLAPFLVLFPGTSGKY